jgi:multiple sugar transport system substrate-binding protein
MDARIGNPGFVKALEDWKAALPSAIPSVTTLGAFETHMAFITGQVAMNIDWTDTGVMGNDPSLSTIAGTGANSAAILPGSTQLWDAQAGKWETLEKPNQPGYAAFGGWIVFIPKNSRNLEAAISLADHLGSAAVMTKASQTPNAGVNPARVSTLDDVAGWVNSAGFKDEAHAANYLDSMRHSLLIDNVVYQLRIPGYSQYEEALELAISEALTDQKTPEQALKDAAASWDAITDRLGRDKQLGYYRSDLGLPAKAE